MNISRLKGRQLCSGTQFGKTVVLQEKIRQQTRAKYHAAIRIVRAKEIKIRNVRMANSLCNSSSKNPWMEIKKIKGVNRSIPTCNDMISLSNTLEDLVCHSSNCIDTNMIHQNLHCICV